MPVKAAPSCLTGLNRRTLCSSDGGKWLVYCIQRNPSCECAPLFCDLAPNFKMARMIKLLAHNHKNCCRKIPEVVTLFPLGDSPITCDDLEDQHCAALLRSRIDRLALQLKRLERTEWQLYAAQPRA